MIISVLFYSGFKEECHICHKKFSRDRTLKIHLNAHAEKKIDEKGIRTAIHDIPIPKTKHTSEDHRVTCNTCHKSFKNSYILKRHQSLHYSEERSLYACPHCPAKFRLNYNLQDHIRGHLHITRYKSKYCSLGFRHIESWRLHNKYHEEKGICKNTLRLKRCKICKKDTETFPTKFLLEEHYKKAHTRPASIPLKKFSVKALTIEDMATLDSVSWCLCNNCGDGFRKKEFKFHRRLCSMNDDDDSVEIELAELEEALPDSPYEECTQEPCLGNQAFKVGAIELQPIKVEVQPMYMCSKNPKDQEPPAKIAVEPEIKYDAVSEFNWEAIFFKEEKPSAPVLISMASDVDIFEPSSTSPPLKIQELKMCVICSQAITTSSYESHVQQQHLKHVSINLVKLLFKSILTQKYRSLSIIKSSTIAYSTNEDKNKVHLLCTKCGQGFRVKQLAWAHKRKCKNRNNIRIRPVNKIEKKLCKSQDGLEKSQATLGRRTESEEVNPDLDFYYHQPDYVLASDWSEDWKSVNLHAVKLKEDKIDKEFVVRAMDSFIPTSDKQFQCKTCNKKCKNRNSAWYHFKIHKEMEFICKFCGMVFSRRNNYLAHYRIHTGERVRFKKFMAFLCNQPLHYCG